MKEKLARFMSGRYGVDQLSRLYLGIALILLVVSIFSHLGIFYIAGIVLLVYTYYRMFSKNISKMYAQNQKYLNAKYRAVVKKDAWKKQWQQRKIYRFIVVRDVNRRFVSQREKVKSALPVQNAEWNS